MAVAGEGVRPEVPEAADMAVERRLAERVVASVADRVVDQAADTIAMRVVDQSADRIADLVIERVYERVTKRLLAIFDERAPSASRQPAVVRRTDRLAFALEAEVRGLLRAAPEGLAMGQIRAELEEPKAPAAVRAVIRTLEAEGLVETRGVRAAARYFPRAGC